MAIKEKELIGMLLPDVSIDEIILEARTCSDNKSGLSVTLNFSIYDVVEDNQISKWFAEEEFQSLVKIRMITSVNGTSQELGSFSLSQLEEESALDPFTFAGTLSRVREVDDKGRVLNQFKFRRTINYDYTPSNLSFSLSSRLDITAMNARYGIELTDAMNPEGNYKVAHERVFSDGELGLTKVYLLPNGTVWNGPKHKMSSQTDEEISEPTYMTGSKHEVTSQNLTVRVVNNYKIQDFRLFKEIEKFEIDASAIHNLQQEINVAGQSSIETLKEDFYSEVWLSRTLEGEAKLMFAVDLKAMVRNRGLFGNLLDKMPPSFQEELLSHCKINSLKLLRKRVRPTTVANSLGTQVKGFTDFDKNQHETLISSGDNKSEFILLNQEDASIRQSKIKTDDSSSSIRFFTASDKSMKLVTDGIYHYGVELDIVDGTREFLIDVKNEILATRNGLVSVLEKMNRATEVKDYSYDPIVNTYVRDFSFTEEEDRKILDVFKCYIKILAIFGRLDAAWSRSLMPIYRSPAFAQEVVKSMDSIASSLESLTQDRLESPGAIYSDSITKPKKVCWTGSGAATEKFLIKDRKFFTNQSFDSNVDKGTGLEFLQNPTDENSASILAEFSEEESTVGLRIVDSSIWQERVQAEIDRFYSSPNPSFNPPQSGDRAQSESINIRGLNSSYLTPSFIVVDSQVNDPILLDVQMSDEMTQQVEEVVLRSNEGERDYFSEFGVSFYDEPEEAILTNADLGTETIETVPTCIMSNRNIRQSPIDALQGWYMENGVVLTTGEDPSTESEEGPQRLTTITDVKLEPPVSKPHDFGISSFTRVFKESVVKGFDSSLKIRSTEGDAEPINPIARFKAPNSMISPVLRNNFKNLPMQIQSLFLMESDADKVRFVEMPPSKFRINFNFLFAVEFLSTFGDDEVHFSNGRKRKNFKMIKEPIWRPLTIDNFINSRGQEMLCRLKRSAIEELDVKVQKNLELPVYDAYFILRPPATDEGSLQMETLDEQLQRAEDLARVTGPGLDFANQLADEEERQGRVRQTFSDRVEAQRRYDELDEQERELARLLREATEQRMVNERIIERGSWSPTIIQEAELRYQIWRERELELLAMLRAVRREKEEIFFEFRISRRSAQAELDAFEAYQEFLRELAWVEFLRESREKERLHSQGFTDETPEEIRERRRRVAEGTAARNEDASDIY